MVGGYLAATLGGIISKGEFNRAILLVRTFLYFLCFDKNSVFAFAISSVSSFFGYFTKGGAIA